MVGHEYTTSTAATPITVAMTMKTKSRVMPRKTRSVGFLPKRVVIQSRLRCMTLRSSDTVTCCISSLFHSTLPCLPGREQTALPGTVAGLTPLLKHGQRQFVLQVNGSLGTSVAGSTPTFHGFDLELIPGDNVLWERYIVEGCRILLAIMRDPPECVRNGHPFFGIRLILLYNPPVKTGDGIGGIARRIDKVEAQIVREGGDILGSRCSAIDRRQYVLHTRILHGCILDIVSKYIG